MSASKKNIIVFDIGNVLLPYDWGRILYALPGVSRTNLYDWLHDEVYDAYEKGLIDEKVLLLEFNKHFHSKFDEQRLFTLFNEIFLEPPGYVGKMIPELAKRYHLYALSNTCHWHEIYFMEKLKDTWVYFEKIFCSHHLHLRKPSEEIYKLVEKEIKAENQKIIFLDDKIENIESAKLAGWHAIHVPTLDEVENQLKKLIDHE